MRWVILSRSIRPLARPANPEAAYTRAEQRLEAGNVDQVLAEDDAAPGRIACRRLDRQGQAIYRGPSRTDESLRIRRAAASAHPAALIGALASETPDAICEAGTHSAGSAHFCQGPGNGRKFGGRCEFMTSIGKTIGFGLITVAAAQVGASATTQARSVAPKSDDAPQACRKARARCAGRHSRPDRRPR